jgi:5-oxoprolinase (ATP-hydrolysing)
VTAPASRNAGFRVGLDIGGTFTDFALLDERTGRLSLHKRLTTPEDPSRGALGGLQELLDREGRDLADGLAVVHATTLVTNAVIERRGARTGMLVTRGFRDVLELAREQRYDIYDLFLEFPPPLVPRPLRREVDERMSRDGTPLQDLDVEQLLEQAEYLVGDGVEAIAVCFLHAYRNPDHEQRAAAALRDAYPNVHVCTSAEVVPEVGEYERMSTAVCNAYVLPVVDRYLTRLEEGLERRGFDGQFHLMHSGGGLLSATTARRLPIRLLESGPTAGAIMAAHVGRIVGAPTLVAFDMGGTTAKMCVIAADGLTRAPELEVARLDRFKRGSGLPIKTQVVDLIEIGAGGGSIAQADSLGLLAVGPRSAGASPGPACYGFGGTDATVTDACVALGYVDAERFAGGSMPLDAGAALEAIDRLGATLEMKADVAVGIHRVACERMASAARAHVIESGLDPRAQPLVAFGGAGPLHAVAVARLLGASEVIVPPMCGVGSAIGLLAAGVSFDYARSAPASLADVNWDEVTRNFDEMEHDATVNIIADRPLRFERSLELRLTGQSHDLEVPVPAGALSVEAADSVQAAFRAEYRRRYETEPPAAPPLAMTWRLRASAPEPDLRIVPVVGDVAPARSRAAWFEATGYVESAVVQRAQLRAGDTVAGPALVEESETTTVVGPSDRCVVDAHLNLRIEVGQQ